MKIQLRIKTIMVFVGVWAILNAIAAWMIRSDPRAIPQHEAGPLFLGMNLAFAFFALIILYSEALNRYTKRGKASDPIRTQRGDDSGGKVLDAIVGFILIFLLIVFYYNTRFFIKHHIDHMSIFVVALVASIVVIACNGILRMRMRRDWSAASLAQLTCRILIIAWIMGSFFTLTLYKPGLMGWGLNPWFPVPPSLLFVTLVTLVLQGAWAASIRSGEHEAGKKTGGRSRK